MEETESPIKTLAMPENEKIDTYFQKANPAIYK